MAVMKARMSFSKSAERSRGIAHFVEDPIAQPRLQSLRRGEVYGPSQNFSKTFPERGKLEKVGGPVELDENVDVAVLARLATGHRPVHTQPAHARARQLVAMCLDLPEEIVGGHGSQYTASGSTKTGMGSHGSGSV